MTYSIDFQRSDFYHIAMSKIEDKNFCHLCLWSVLKSLQKFNKRMARFKNVNQKNNIIIDIIWGHDLDLSFELKILKAKNTVLERGPENHGTLGKSQRPWSLWDYGSDVPETIVFMRPWSRDHGPDEIMIPGPWLLWDHGPKTMVLMRPWS